MYKIDSDFMYKFFFGGGIVFGQILATSAKITPNRGLVREFPQKYP